MGTIIIALLALTMAIFPISMPGAAASTGHSHAAPSSGHTTHAGGHDANHEASAHASVTCHERVAGTGCADHAQGAHDQGDQTCCGGVSCHSFQVSTAPVVASPLASPVPVAIAGDEQVTGIVAGRLERPPRTV